MSILVSAHQLKKSFSSRPLFQGLTFSISQGERIGLIGPNGAGKSTLMRLLASDGHPDEGTLSFQKGLRVGYLEQVPQFLPKATIQSTLLEGTTDPHDWENLALSHELASKLELEAFGLETPIDRLSGGWKKRVALARELMKRPDLLLLDEPTNHLDVESIMWLEQFITQAPYAVLTITHDRVFLQRVSNRIIELDPRNAGGLLSVQGDYADYLETKEQLMNAQERQETTLKNTLRRETEWLRRGAKARTTKQQARIDRHGELSKQVDELTTRNQVRSAQIDFQSSEKKPKKLIQAEGISKAYGDRVIFKDFDLVMRPGTRIGIVGANGAGKSTLIRVLLGDERPDSGTVQHSEHLSVAYFEQNRETLDPEMTVAKAVCPNGEFVDYRGNRVHIRGYLDRFMFSQQQMDMRLGKLSGGEQSRLLLARLMLVSANIMVLDEPTNDLDMATLNILEDCLKEFDGAVILVSHDRYFLDQVSTQILAFEPVSSPNAGRLVSYSDLSQWEVARKAAKAAEEKALKAKSLKPAQSEAESNSAMPAVSESKKLSFSEKHELAGMEAKIRAAEKQLAQLIEKSQAPEVLNRPDHMKEVVASMAKAQVDVERLYERWTELESRK